LSKSKNNKQLYITEDQLKNLFMGSHKELILIYLKDNRIKLNNKALFLGRNKELILIYLKDNRIKLNNKTINTILYYTINYIKFNKDFYSFIFNLAQKYNVIKKKIINLIISASNYEALIFLEKDNFGIFTLRDKLLSLISHYDEELYLPLFKELISQNNISYKLRKELIIKSVNEKSFNFTLFLLNFEKPITSPLLMFCIEEAIKSYSFELLSFLYLTYTVSEKEIIDIYKLFAINKFNPEGVFFNEQDILRKIKQDYERVLINQKLSGFL